MEKKSNKTEKNSKENKNYSICKDKKDGVSGCRDCCKRYFINYEEYKSCVSICMNN